jgi:hypothetical protein
MMGSGSLELALRTVPAKNPIRPTIDLDRTCNILSSWVLTVRQGINPHVFLCRAAYPTHPLHIFFSVAWFPPHHPTLSPFGRSRDSARSHAEQSQMSSAMSLTQLSGWTFPQEGQDRVLQENGTRFSWLQLGQMHRAYPPSGPRQCIRRRATLLTKTRWSAATSSSI